MSTRKKSQRSLKKWTDEDWGYVTKKDEKKYIGKWLVIIE